MSRAAGGKGSRGQRRDSPSGARSRQGGSDRQGTAGGRRAAASGPSRRAAGPSRAPKRGPRVVSGQRGTTPARSRPEARSLGGEQVEGRHAVRELLLVGARRTREVIVERDRESSPLLDDIAELARELKVPVREVGRGRFEALARTDAPQGVVALAAPLREHPLDELAAPSNGRPPFLVLLDGVTDPGNVGALLRSAECAGVSGVVFPRHRAAHVTPTVAKSAAGAIEHLRMATVPGLPTALRELSRAGVWMVGLDAAAETSLFDLDLADQPVALVLGAEGAGLSRLVRERCDVVVSIPLLGRLNSLNVSVAGALACYEVARRRHR